MTGSEMEEIVQFASHNKVKVDLLAQIGPVSATVSLRGQGWFAVCGLREELDLCESSGGLSGIVRCGRGGTLREALLEALRFCVESNEPNLTTAASEALEILNAQP